jgi:hypothetical protein
MQRSFSRLIGAALLTAAFAAAAGAAAQERTQQREQVRERVQERAGHREIIPGSELMTPAEREAYRKRYAAAQTDADRDKVRAGHVMAMDERARLRGLRLAEPVAPAGARR